jgi:glucose-fructose oxidoreductase
VSRLRLAVIGCGAVSQLYHLPAARQVPGVALTALVDTDRAHAETLAREYGVATVLDDHRALPGTVDAAIVATSNGSHAEIACFLLEQGIHVLCEKPMATSVADGERMRETAARGPARLLIGQSRRFNANVMLLKELVSGGALGTIRTITASLGGNYKAWPQRTDFRRQRSLSGGGVLLDLGIHLIDMARWIAGEPASVTLYEAADRLEWGVENDAEVQLRFPSGATAVIACSYTHGLDRTLRVEGTDGWARTGVDPAPGVTFAGNRARLCRRTGAVDLLVEEADPYLRQLEHFVDCIVEDRPFVVQLDEVLDGLRVIDFCYRLPAPRAA